MKTPGIKDTLQTERPDAVRARHDKARKWTPSGGNGSGTQRPAILDPRDPLHSARELVAARHTDGVGRRLLHRHRGTFWLFDQNCYRLADDETIRAVTWDFLGGSVRRDDKGEHPFKPNRARVSDVIDAMASVCNLHSRIEPPAWLDGTNNPPAAELFPVANGLLHLASGELSPATPSYFGLAASNVAFTPAAPKPKQWLAFLADLFGSDTEAIVTLQDWFGYALSADTSQHKILLVVGPPRSGKGTIARVLAALVGDGVAAPTLAALQTNFGLAPLIGKSLAIISDARLGGRSNQAAIAERLLSISGEDALTVDRKFLPAWTGRISTRFMMLTNELPRLSDASGALAKRFVILVLERSFYGKEDPALTSRLLTELPGILNWARRGYLRLRQRGYFVQPSSAHDAIDQLEALASPITAFVREQCTLGSALRISCELLYQAWRSWCTSNGRDKPGSIQTFGRDLGAAFPMVSRHRPRDGDERTPVYQGIGLK